MLKSNWANSTSSGLFSVHIDPLSLGPPPPGDVRIGKAQQARADPHVRHVDVTPTVQIDDFAAVRFAVIPGPLVRERTSPAACSKLRAAGNQRSWRAGTIVGTVTRCDPRIPL